MIHKVWISLSCKRGLFLVNAPELKTIELFYLMPISLSKMVIINKPPTAFSKETTKWQPSKNSKKYGKMPWKRLQIIRTCMRSQAVDTTLPCRKLLKTIGPQWIQLLIIRWLHRLWASVRANLKLKREPRKKSTKSITARTRVCSSIIFRELNNKDHPCSLGSQTEIRIIHYLQWLHSSRTLSRIYS